MFRHLRNFPSFSFLTQHAPWALWFRRGLGFSLFYWLVESVRWAVLHGPHSLATALYPDTLTFWVRLLMVGFILLFSLAVPLRLLPAIRSNTHHREAIQCMAMAVGLALGYWLLGGLQAHLLAPGQPFWTSLFSGPEHRFWLQMEAVFVLLFFGAYAQSIVNGQAKRTQAIEAETRRLQALLFDLPYAVCLLDTQGEVSVANRAFKTRFQPWITPRPDESRREAATRFIQGLNLETAMDKARKGEAVFIDQMPLGNGDETRHFEVTLFPVFAESGTPRLGLLWREITGQVDAEAENRRLQSELLHVQKMDAIGMLAGGIAHDFNNLITAIQGSAEMAMLDVDPQGSVHEDLVQIQMASERAANLTRQLLLFSRKHPMTPKSQDLNALLEQLLKMLHRLVGETISMVTDFDPRLWPAALDQGTVEQAVVNLVVNARNAMPQGGRIKLSTRNARDTETADMESHAVCLAVEDTGCGMDQATLERIFEPFYSTRKGQGGTGLGLAVVHGIVKQHSGWLKVSSQPGRGTRFELYFPASESLDIVEDSHQEMEIMELGQGESILVVEDDASVRRFTVQALRKHGYRVEGAETAQEALALFQGQNRNFDLLLSDLVLPDQSGLELARALMQRDHRLRCIVGSGYFDRPQDEAASADADIQFLRKPYDLATLLSAVRQVLDFKPSR